VIEVVSFASTLTNTSKHGVTFVLFGDVTNEFLNDDSLTHTSTTERTNFSTLHKGSDQVDDFDTSFEHLGFGGDVFEWRSRAVDGSCLLDDDWFAFVDDLADDVEDTTERLFTNWDGDWSASVDDFQTTT